MAPSYIARFLSGNYELNFDETICQIPLGFIEVFYPQEFFLWWMQAQYPLRRSSLATMICGGRDDRVGDCFQSQRCPNQNQNLRYPLQRKTDSSQLKLFGMTRWKVSSFSYQRIPTLINFRLRGSVRSGFPSCCRGDRTRDFCNPRIGWARRTRDRAGRCRRRWRPLGWR